MFHIFIYLFLQYCECWRKKTHMKLIHEHKWNEKNVNTKSKKAVKWKQKDEKTGAKWSLENEYEYRSIASIKYSWSKKTNIRLWIKEFAQLDVQK